MGIWGPVTVSRTGACILEEVKRQEENPDSGAGFNRGRSFLLADEFGFHLVVNGNIGYFKLGSDTELLEG